MRLLSTPPSLAEPRYIWQRGHIWATLGDQPSNSRPPILLPKDAPPDAPILNPTPGDALDYLNLFHATVGYWMPGSKAVISRSAAHPILQGLNLKSGDEVPGPWGGEVDIAYEPQAWDISSATIAPEPRSRSSALTPTIRPPSTASGLPSIETSALP